jgi:hypothetical protein
MTKPICPFTPTSNLIVERPQIILDLVSKDVEKVVFQKMEKIFEFGRVQYLIFTFGVSSKVRVYENLKNVFQEVVGQQLTSHQARYEESDTVENSSKITLDLSLRNVKNAFFESMKSYRNKNGVTSLAFTFITLSTEPIYEELEDQKRESKGFEQTPPLPSLATHPARRGVSNPLYGLVTKRKNPLGKIMGFFNKCFPRRSFPIELLHNLKF